MKLDQRRESYKIKPLEADARPRRVSAPNITENPAQKGISSFALSEPIAVSEAFLRPQASSMG